MTTGRINQGTVSAVRVPPPPGGPQRHRGTSSYLLLLLLSAHSRTCRPAHTRPAPQVLGNAPTVGNRVGVWLAPGLVESRLNASSEMC
jgi:hypothetical protein